MAGPCAENGSFLCPLGCPVLRTPPGKRKPGRPKTTWCQTVMAELSEVQLTWGEAQHAAQNRARWKDIVVTLCPTGDKED